MEKMLINAPVENPGEAVEIRVALVEKDNTLFDLDIEKSTAQKKKANIYKGRITRIEPSLEAAFVDYGAKKQGFLPFKEITEGFLKPLTEEQKAEPPSIAKRLTEGQELMVQIEKEERGTKGAALTTFVTLAGCYLVLMPNNPRSGGISRRIDGDDRDELKELIEQLNVPNGMSLIVRTAGLGKELDELKWDLEFLINQWEAIKQVFTRHPAPVLIHQEGDVILRSIRDNLRKSVSEIIIDNPDAYAKAKRYLEQVKPDFLANLKLYNSAVPLFSRYKIESQIEVAYRRTVVLPSGGSLVIDNAEALVAIDINSAKSTGGTDIETTAFHTNLEAADEIARQLRIRDLGGLIVIDFIDMSSNKHQREVENRLREALKSDRARIQLGRISRFGLLEMSRQRLRLSLGESTQERCSACNGRGVVRSTPSYAQSLIRLLEDEALDDKICELQLQLPLAAGTFILNEKRATIAAIQSRHNVNIVIVPNPHMQMPNHQLQKTKGERRGKRASYDLIDVPEIQPVKAEAGVVVPDHAARHVPITPATGRSRQEDSEKQAEVSKGLLQWLWQKLFGDVSKTGSDPSSADDATAQETAKSGHKVTPLNPKQHQRRQRPNQHRNNHPARNNNRRRNYQQGQGQGGQGGQGRRQNQSANGNNHSANTSDMPTRDPGQQQRRRRRSNNNGNHNNNSAKNGNGKASVAKESNSSEA